MYDKLNRIKELISILTKASNVYYNTSNTVISDYEYDTLYNELTKLEEETNIILSNSPTHKVGYESLDKLDKVEHNHLMLSLDKCHSAKELIKFAGVDDCLLMVKLDGLTVSLEYNNGELIGAETRGNGYEGSNIYQNALNFANVPIKIDYKEHLIIDGEAIITYEDFNKINEQIENEEDKYKNPRNLVSGTVTMLNPNIVKERNVRFIAWKVIEGFDEIIKTSNFFKLKKAENYGFDIIPMWTFSCKSDSEFIDVMLEDLKNKCINNGIPFDGAVMCIDNIETWNSKGKTDKFYKGSVAYKYEDDVFPTKLKYIDWTLSRNGKLTPTAVFDTVKIDGTDVNRASLHNVSLMKSLGLTNNCTVYVYKANMIIPQIESCDCDGDGEITIPTTCPICGSKTSIIRDNETEVLMCTNENCKGRLLGKLTHYVSKHGMNIDGLSEATLQKLIDLKWVNSFCDLYELKSHKEEMYKLDGFGKKSVDKLLKAIEDSKQTDLQHLLIALGIPNVGRDASKKLSNDAQRDSFFFSYLGWNNYDFSEIEGIGSVINNSIHSWFKNEENSLIFDRLSNILSFTKVNTNTNISTNNTSSSINLTGKTFVITGSLNHYLNRDELKSKIESLGGKVSGSVSSKTSYLINNDNTSKSSKNKTAHDLNIPIITENDFISMIGE